MTEKALAITENTNLAEIQEFNAGFIFDPENVDQIIEVIRKELTAEVPDMSTPKGRARIKSRAHSTAKARVLIDNMGKDHVADLKATTKGIDAQRKKLREAFEKIQADIRKPVDDWEAAEKSRTDAITARIDAMKLLANTFTNDPIPKPLSGFDLAMRLDEIKAIEVDETFSEFMAQAKILQGELIVGLEALIAERIATEKQEKEAKRLKLEEDERNRLAREKKIADDAAAKATREATEKADREKQEAADKVTRDAKELADKVEKDKNNAAAKVALDKKLALEKAEAGKKAAKKKIDDAALAESIRLETERKDKERREADVNNRKAKNNEALQCFIAGGLTEDVAKLAVELIAKRQVTNVFISY